VVNYKIIFNRKDCIGAFACNAISPKLWEPKEDGKVDLKQGKLNPNTGFYELTIDEANYLEALDSAQVCPVNVIMIEKIEDSGEIKKIYPEEKSQ